MANTGYKAWTTLAKVTDDVNEYPLDINGDLCSVSGLPQATKPNTEGQPDYVAPVTDYVTCPVSGSVDYIVKLTKTSGNQYVTAKCYNKSTDVLANAPVDIYVEFFYKITGGASQDDFVTILSGTDTISKREAFGSTTIDIVTKSAVSPTSYGGGTIE